MMRDDDSDTLDRHPDRLERLGHPLRRKPAGGPRELTPRHRLLISYMIDGVAHRSILARITRPRAVIDEAGNPAIRDVSPEPYEPLTLIEAADLLRIRRRNARELMTLPIFRDAYELELQRYRNGEKAASLRTLVEVRDDEGAGKAADRKVRMAAAQAIMGEGEGNRGGTTVNVSVGTRITAGIVVRLPASAQMTPLERPNTIEHDDANRNAT